MVRNHIHYGDIEPSPTNDLYPSWYVGGNIQQEHFSDHRQGFRQAGHQLYAAAAKEYAYNANVASWNIDIFNGGIQNIGRGSSSSRQ